MNASPPQTGFILAELEQIRESCLAMEQEFGPAIAQPCPQVPA